MTYAPRLHGNSGLVDLPPYRSSVTRQEMRFISTLALRYGIRPPPPPSSSSSGLVAFQDSPIIITSSHLRREFTTEAYVQAKNHVRYMMDHPYEKTLQYKVDRVREITRVCMMRVKRNVFRGCRVIFVPIYECWKGLWRCSMKILRVVIDQVRGIMNAVPLVVPISIE